MKILKRVSLFVFILPFLIILFCGKSYAFHNGGVGECTGCHSMHSPSSDGSFFLKGTDQGSTCLICHENSGDTGPNDYHISTADSNMSTGLSPKQRTPGGDFGWLKKSYNITIGNVTTIEAGERHGHNIIAVDKNYVADNTNNKAPGGSFVSSDLSCISCHDPHGKYRRLGDGTIDIRGAPIISSGSYDNSPDPVTGQSAVGVYRLLGGIGFANSKTSNVSFTANPPAAVAPSNYNRSESSTQTYVAYGKGISRWCANCHSDMHSDTGKSLHPIDRDLGSSLANNYNSYVKSGDITGVQASSYLSLVPYEENSTDYSSLKTIAGKSGSSPISGPASNSQVMCLTCHRAHATGWNHMFRWDNDADFIVYNSLWPGTDTIPSNPEYARGRLAAETQAAYYDRPATVFASYQRSLCNKCHNMD